MISALSIKEPWLSMIVDGKKTVETRTWPAPAFLYSQSLLLVGSKKPEGRYSGKAACLVQVVDCRPMTKEDEIEACCEIYPGAFSWVLRNVTKVKPVPIKGQLGIYKVESQLVEVFRDGLV